jgi:photosystem II stability/assembly factor-like uncharacterized protein
LRQLANEVALLPGQFAGVDEKIDRVFIHFLTQITMRKQVCLLLTGLLVLISAGAQAQWVNKAVPFGDPAQFNVGISAVDANVAWTTVYEYDGPNDGPTPLVSRTTDGGATWLTRPVTGLSATGIVTSLCALDASTAWATTADFNGAGGVVKTTDGGATWALQTTATQFASASSYPALVSFFDANTGVAIGNPDAAGFEIYTTTNGGSTWVRVPAANTPAPLEREKVSNGGTMLARSGNSIWFGTDKSRVLRSADRGQTWAVGVTPLDRIEGKTMAFRDLDNGLAIDEGGGIARTTDGGATWTRLSPAGPLHVIGLDHVPGTQTYVSTGFDGTINGAGSSRSTDDGQTWVAIESTINHVMVDFVSPTVGWSGGVIVLPNEELRGNGMNLYSGPALGTNSALAARLGISTFPNPASDRRFTVRAPGLKAATTARVLDGLGRQVLVQDWRTPHTVPLTLSLNGQAAGVYVLEVSTPEGLVRQKLVVR